MQEYKYTYQDWVEGIIQPEELESLMWQGELSDEVFIQIQKEQEEAYTQNVKTHFDWKIGFFLDKYDQSLMRNDLLNNEISKTQADILLYKNKYSQIYTEALEGVDGRYNLTYSDVKLINSHYEGIYTSEGQHWDLIIKKKYFEWLLWLKNRDIKDDSFPDFEFNGYGFAGEVKPEQSNFKENKKPIRQAKKQVSYTWLGNDDELPKLYQLLKAKELIQLDTTKEHFEAVFDAKPLQEIQVPIKWHDDNVSELLYFVQQLQGPNGWLIEKEERANYKRLTACFVKPDGERFPIKNLRQSKNNVSKYGISKDGSQAIDSIILQFS